MERRPDLIAANPQLSANHMQTTTDKMAEAIDGAGSSRVTLYPLSGIQVSTGSYAISQNLQPLSWMS